MTISIIKNCSIVLDQKSLMHVSNYIREGKYQDYDIAEKVAHLRQLLKDGNKDEYDRLKKQLYGFTACGRFAETRKTSTLEEYSHHVILDIDGLTPEQVTNL